MNQTEVPFQVLLVEAARRRSVTNLDQSINASKERCKSLAGFIREAWHVLEPSTPLVWGWHLDAICQHLEAAYRGEIKSNRLIINIPPGPMRDDSLVETARGPVALRDVVVGDLVLTHKGRYQPVTAVHHQGVLPILKIVTNGGRVTHAAPSHPYLTPNGWVDAGDLQVGDVLAVVNRHEDRPCAPAIPEDEARLLGYLVGDGSLTQATASFVNSDREVIDDFTRCANACGFKTSESQRPSHWQVRLLGGPSVKAFLRNHGLEGKSSYHKRIPPAVMCADRSTIANFVGAYWTCDGGFDVRPTVVRGSRYRTYGTTVSENLAHDLVYALALLGIEGRLRTKRRRLETAAQPGGTYTSYSIEVQREEMTARFAALPGLCSAKREKAKACGATFDQPLWNDPVVTIEASEAAPCMCLTVAEDHSFVCSGIAVKNTMKSLAVNVFFPMWVWGPMGDPAKRFIGMAHEEGLGIRDNLRCRRLVQSDWFQDRWPITLAGDQNEKKNFENTATGFRQVATKNITGKRGNFVLIDDPISVNDARSPVEREAINEWFRESLPTRLTDPVLSVIILIMQRLHEDDPTGLILAQGWGWDHLMLPMRFEADRRCVTSIGFRDPRTLEGELLFPQRFPEETTRQLERTLGPFAVAGQLQQRPVPREGAMFKRSWFKIVKAVPAGTRLVRYWDLAATAEQFGADPAYTCGLALGLQPDGRYIVTDVARLRAEGVGVRRLIKNTARDDGRFVEIGLPVDPGAAGKTVAEDMVAMLSGYVVSAVRETGDKVTRAEPIAAQAEVGNVDILEGDWNEAFFAELTTFPGSKFKDQVDALSGAFSKLMRGGMFKTPETQFAIEPVPVPSIYGRAAALVVTQRTVSLVWGAFQSSSDTLFIYHAVSMPRQDIALHTDVLLRQGAWIPTLFDIEDGQRSKDEGWALGQSIADRGVNLSTVPLEMESACDAMASRLARGGLRVFSTLTNWFAEYRRIGRDEKGQIADAEAGIIRATAMLVAHGADVAVTENRARSDAQGFEPSDGTRSTTTGY